MDPRDFISLAIRLSNANQEAELRTAVGRAYYGSFHLARLFVEEAGVRWPRKDIYAAEIHRKVRYCLSESADVDAMLASDKLWSLRDLRNKADYDLESGPYRKDGVAAILRMAQEILDALQRCRSGTTFNEARERIATYARDVLHLTIEE